MLTISRADASLERHRVDEAEVHDIGARFSSDGFTGDKGTILRPYHSFDASSLVEQKPRAERDSADVIIRRLRPKLAEVTGIVLYLQPVQDLQLDTRVGAGLPGFVVGEGGVGKHGASKGETGPEASGQVVTTVDRCSSRSPLCGCSLPHDLSRQQCHHACRSCRD